MLCAKDVDGSGQNLYIVVTPTWCNFYAATRIWIFTRT
jgi:hypothetical protein